MLPELSKPRTAILALAMVLALAALVASSAAASPSLALAQEEQQGEALAESVRSGEKQCSELSADDFELVGEYAMGGYLGNEAAHAAMNRRMTLMMGEAGERRMHTALGYRYTNCAGGPDSEWVGTMAGMMGGNGSGGYGPGMMRGRNNSDGAYSGSMMGSGHHGGDVSVLGAIVIALAAAVIGAGVATLLMQRQRSGEDTGS